MKKLIVSIISLSLACGMAACGNSDSSTTSSNATTTTTMTTTTAKSEMVTTTDTTTTTETETVSQESTTTTTEATTTAETTTQNNISINDTNEYVNAIGTKLEITDITKMAAEMIDAEDGTSFKYNGNKFEIYKFSDGNPKLEEAKSGSISYTLEGLGDFTSTTVVNGNYVMLFKTEDSTVIDEFMSITL